MATNPFVQYGLKEVADVIVYDISSASPVPVMFFDTLKISSIEMTAEATDARGGKGNPKLISWDYGKEITLTLQDALLSMKSLNLLLDHDAGATNPANVRDYTAATLIKKAEVVTLSSAKAFVPKYTPAGTVYVLDGATAATSTTTPVGGFIYSAGASGDQVRIVYDTQASASSAYEIVITPERFPGTYMFVGDTVIRNKKTGVDEGFQFIIPKAKIGSEVSFTMEAEGDPSVFDMTISVLKADNGTMMSLVKYELPDSSSTVASNLTLA